MPGGNSASGSKYYPLTVPTGGTSSIRPTVGSDPNYGPDPLNPQNHWANSVENQEHVRSYVKVLVRNNLLSVQNVRSGTCAPPSASSALVVETRSFRLDFKASKSNL